MPSKGNRGVKVRLTEEEIELLDATWKAINKRRFQTPWTRASFLRSCILERLDKLERGRKKPSSSPAMPPTAGPQTITTAEIHEGHK